MSETLAPQARRRSSAVLLAVNQREVTSSCAIAMVATGAKRGTAASRGFAKASFMSMPGMQILGALNFTSDESERRNCSRPWFPLFRKERGRMGHPPPGDVASSLLSSHRLFLCCFLAIIERHSYALLDIHL